MRVFEIKELLKEGKSLSDLIQLKSYIPFVEKKILCDKIIEGSLYEENGMLLCNYYDKKLFIEISIINNYTDIELDEENIVGDYDILCELGIVEHILKCLDDDEKYFIYDMVEDGICQKIKIGNSMESVVKKGLDKFVNIIDKNMNVKEINKLIKTASKELQKFEPEKLKSLQDMMKIVK